MTEEIISRPYDILSAIASKTPVIHNGNTTIKVSSYSAIGTESGFIDVSIATPGKENPTQFVITPDNRGHRWGDQEHSESIAQSITQTTLDALHNTQ